MTLAPIRQRAIQILSSRVGLCADPADPARRRAYLATIAPNEPRDMVEFLGRPNDPRTSSCGFVPTDLYRQLGIEHARFRLPLQPGYAIERNFQVAREAGALVSWRAGGPRPLPGDAVYLFSKYADNTSQHIYCPISEPDSAGVMRTVDGGQLNPRGYQLIDYKRHTITASGFDQPSGRKVIQWIDLERLAEHFGWCPRVLEDETDPDDTQPMQTPTVCEGIDVASVNGEINWLRVRNAGIQFAYLRAMIGRDDVDKRLDVNAAGCRAVGLPFGVYGVCYPRHGKAQDAFVQARQLQEQHVRVGASLDPMADVEVRNGCTDAEIQAAAREYHETLGPRSLHYTYPAFQAQWDPWFASRRLWIAHYAPEKPGLVPQIPRPWISPLLWQYAASEGVIGRVDGSPGPIDRNRLYGNLDSLVFSKK